MTCPPHHWLLDTPSPGVKRVPARCKRCDATSTFLAFEDDGSETWLETAKRKKQATITPKPFDSYYQYPELTPAPAPKARSTMTEEEEHEWEARMRRQAS